MAVCWSDLPPELVELIIKKLTCVIDVIRFGAVSVQWKNVYRGFGLSSLPRQPPLLMSVDQQRHALNFFSLSRGRGIFRRHLQMPRNCRYIGSTEGWLVIELGTGYSNSIVLWNPFLTAKNVIFLPLLKPKFQKVVLSANPATTPNYVVVAIYGKNPRLVFCRSGQENWSEVEDIHDRPVVAGIQDVIFYNQQVYAVDYRGYVLSCDINATNPLLGYFAELPRRFYNQYLVESSGDLLVVNLRGGTVIGIYKIDQPDAEMYIPDQILFVGCISSMSVQVSDFPGCSRLANCIVFCDGGTVRQRKQPCETKVYKFEDRGNEKPFRIVHRTATILIEPRL